MKPFSHRFSANLGYHTSWFVNVKWITWTISILSWKTFTVHFYLSWKCWIWIQCIQPTWIYIWQWWMTDLTVHKCDGERKEMVPVSGGFGVQCSVSPTRGEKLKQVMSTVWGVCSDFPWLFPESGCSVSGCWAGILDVGLVSTNNLFCRPDCPL